MLTTITILSRKHDFHFYFTTTPCKLKNPKQSKTRKTKGIHIPNRRAIPVAMGMMKKMKHYYAEDEDGRNRIDLKMLGSPFALYGNAR